MQPPPSKPGTTWLCMQDRLKKIPEDDGDNASAFTSSVTTSQVQRVLEQNQGKSRLNRRRSGKECRVLVNCSAADARRNQIANLSTNTVGKRRRRNFNVSLINSETYLFCLLSSILASVLDNKCNVSTTRRQLSKLLSQLPV